MRFRSIGISAPNLRDYLKRIKEEEDNYINESILAHIGFITLEDSNNKDGLLGPNSIYKLTYLKSQAKKRRRKIMKFHHYRKKLHFHYQTNKNNSRNENNVINSNRDF